MNISIEAFRYYKLNSTIILLMLNYILKNKNVI